MIAMKDDATSLFVIYGVSISGLALFAYFLFRSARAVHSRSCSTRLSCVTRALQPKHGRVQLHVRRHIVPAARHEQRRPLAALLLRQQGHGLHVLVRVQFVWPLCPHAHVFGKRGRQPGALPPPPGCIRRSKTRAVQPAAGEVRGAGASCAGMRRCPI
jgi:hypothetical protein